MADMVLTSGGESRTVLLIEDNPGDARLIAAMLEDAPETALRLEWTAGLTEGLERLARGGVELVLLDLSLPESQGLDSFERVRAHSPAVPVVVLTGHSDEGLGNRAVQSGAQDYLIKGQVDAALLGRALRYAIERARIDEELRRRAEQLLEMDRRKDEFLAMLAHELRNPLAAMNSAVAVAARAGDAPGELAWCMEIVNRQIKHFGRLIDDLLDVSRITRGKVQLQQQNIDAASVLAQAVETARSLFDERQQALAVDFGPGLWLDADATRLEQIVVNLLSNAAKYTESGGRIALTAGREGNEVVIRVKDNGIGIPIEKLPLMFELFTQGDRTLARSEGGLGIGLTLARSLAEMHGGSLTGTSEGPGRGSEFVVRLPAAERTAQAESPAGPESRPAAQRRARVLVVDDSLDTARAMARWLKLLGHEVWAAHDGPTAIEAVRSHRPQFILLDIGLPRLDGYQVVRLLRREDCGRDAVIIAVSGYGQDDDRRRSAEAGFDHHLVKPIDHDALLALLGRE